VIEARCRAVAAPPDDETIERRSRQTAPTKRAMSDAERQRKRRAALKAAGRSTKTSGRLEMPAPGVTAPRRDHGMKQAKIIGVPLSAAAIIGERRVAQRTAADTTAGGASAWPREQQDRFIELDSLFQPLGITPGDHRSLAREPASLAKVRRYRFKPGAQNEAAEPAAQNEAADSKPAQCWKRDRYCRNDVPS
jgi:hypothetical protein